MTAQFFAPRPGARAAIDTLAERLKKRAIHREKKSLAFDFAEGSASGVFEGYASLFNIEDQARDVVAPGAFRASLRAKGVGGIKLLYQHFAYEPIGVWTDIEEDAHGLFVRGKLLPEIARAREVLALMRAGALDGLSIGFEVKRAAQNRAAGTRILQEIDLWEISIVTFPLLREARVTRVKKRRAPGRVLAERALARALRDGAEKLAG